MVGQSRQPDVGVVRASSTISWSSRRTSRRMRARSWPRPARGSASQPASASYGPRPPNGGPRPSPRPRPEAPACGWCPCTARGRAKRQTPRNAQEPGGHGPVPPIPGGASWRQPRPWRCTRVVCGGAAPSPSAAGCAGRPWNPGAWPHGVVPWGELATALQPTGVCVARGPPLVDRGLTARRW